MSLKKVATILAAAGALAAISVPAMAFENEFHGMYKMKYFVSNSEAGGSSFITPAATSVVTATGVFNTNMNATGTAGGFLGTENLKTNNYFEQRARLQYIAKASDDLRLVTHFEIDSVFGDYAQGGITRTGTGIVTAAGTATRGSGGALEADAVNLETKHVFLDFKIPSTTTRVTAGIQPVKDAFKGIFLDVDLAGVNTVSKFGPATVGLGYFRAYDQSYFGTGRPKGMDNLDILSFSTDFSLSKDTKLGMAYYLYADGRFYSAATPAVPTADAGSTTTLHVLGLNGESKLGPVTLSGFAAMQQGQAKSRNAQYINGTTTLSGYAFNLAAKAAAGPGNFRTAFLFTSGDDGRDNINTAWQSVSTTWGNGFAGVAANTSGNSNNESNMMLLNRATNMGGTSTDNSLVYTTNNKNQGLWLYSLGYDANITPKFYANANLGFAWTSKTNYSSTVSGANTSYNRPGNATDKAYNGTNFLGSELNIETGYKMYDNLTASFQAAYVMLGGYYKGTVVTRAATATAGAVVADPENPYTARIILSYAF